MSTSGKNTVKFRRAMLVRRLKREQEAEKATDGRLTQWDIMRNRLWCKLRGRKQ
jgi:hypothetical protein